MERHFDHELSNLKEKLLRMSSLAEESISASIKAIVERDMGKIKKIIESDNAINMLEIEIDQLCMRSLALYQPEAGDLRFIISAMKINNDLERIGDLAVNIAQRGEYLLSVPLLKPLIDIPRMAQAAQGMLKDSINSFVNSDAKLAMDVCIRDDEVDKLNDQIFRELLTYMMQDQKTIERALALILIARNLERIADHSTNIAEDVIYIVEGRTIKHHVEEKKEDFSV